MPNWLRTILVGLSIALVTIVVQQWRLPPVVTFLVVTAIVVVACYVLNRRIAR
jgi:hypothetical protein